MIKFWYGALHLHMRLLFLTPALIGSTNDRNSHLTNWQVGTLVLKIEQMTNAYFPSRFIELLYIFK